MKTIYIHIGYHKVSSTFLQRKIFPYLKGVDYLGVNYKKIEKISLKEIKNLKFSESQFQKYGIVSDFAYNIGVAPSINLSKKTINEFLNKINESKFDKILISSEDFLRPFFFNEMAFYLSDILSNYNVEIIMLIREQKSIINSRYIHDLKIFNKKYFLSNALNNISNNELCYYPVCKHLNKDVECICEKKKYKILNLEFYNYNLVFDVLKKHFSKVNVIPFEVLYKNNFGLSTLINIIGTNFINGNLSDVYKMKQNYQSKDEKLNFNTENSEFLKKIENYYKDSNKLLDSKLNEVNLEEIGYY